MLINELSKKSGVSKFTIRYYEKYGLIRGKRNQAVDSNNYYHYDDETLYKLELIRDAKRIGFSLAEIKKLIDAWYNKKYTVSKKINILDDKLKMIDEKIKELKEMKKLLNMFKKEVEEFDC